MQLGRKARTMEDLLEDKTFLYHVGQLIGSCEMAGHWMQRHMEGDVQDMGAKLLESSTWFFKDVKGKDAGKRDRENPE